MKVSGISEERLGKVSYAVADVDAGVYNVDGGTGASGSVIDIASRAGSLVRDAAKTPWSTSAGGQGIGLHLSILLDPSDLVRVSHMKHMRFGWDGDLRVAMRRSRQ
jgi:hypothetical protein